MTSLAIPLLIGATATAGYSAYQQGKTAAAQAKQEAAWHAYNAKVAEREAEAERKASEFEATQHKRQADKLLARQRALIGGSGVTAEGSPLLVMEDTAAQLALENANLRETGARRVSAFKSQAILDFTKSRYASKSAKGHKQAGLLSAGGSLLQGASGVAYMRSQGSSWLPKGKPKRQALATLAKY
jgi:hypothetical protein